MTYSPSTFTKNTLARASLITAEFAAIATEFATYPTVTVMNEDRATYAVDTGAADAYLVALPTALSAYTAGLRISMKVLTTNTGASTIDVDSVGVKNIKRFDGTALAAGDLTAGAVALLQYDGTNFMLVSHHGSDVTASAASAAAAAASASAASTSESNASASASTASTQASNASTSASNASTSETNASTSASNASTSESNASTSESNASTSASTASTQASNASTSASNAGTSETNAGASESAAAASESAAAASASAASSSETAAAASAAAALVSENAAAASAATIDLTAPGTIGGTTPGLGNFTTVDLSGDTSVGDAAAVGYTAAEGIVITGQGSSNDVTIKNDADAVVAKILTGTTNFDIIGNATAAAFEPTGDTAASDNAAFGYTAAEGAIITGQGSSNDVTLKNDADAVVAKIPTGTTNFTVTGTITATDFAGDGSALTGLSADPAAFSGVIETDGTYVDACIFGPARDGVQWDEILGLSTVKKLMIATVKDAGADGTVEFWDATDSAVVGGSALASVTITGAATVTSIAASMGYVIVGHEDGITIIDPHDGSWAERTVGWPRSLSTSTTPALVNNNVNFVFAAVYDNWPYDPRTGGHMPCFVISYSAGGEAGSLIKYDGNVWDQADGTSGLGCFIFDEKWVWVEETGNARYSWVKISEITADDPSYNSIMMDVASYPDGLGADTSIDWAKGLMAAADTAGLTFVMSSASGRAASGYEHPAAKITRTYNSGYNIGIVKGSWLANSATADRSYKANTLTENGTVTEGSADGASGELLAYSGFVDSTNNLFRASDADWDVLGTGAGYMSIWVKSSGSTTTEYLMGVLKSGGAIRFNIALSANTNGVPTFYDDGATALVALDATSTVDDGAWHKVDAVRVSSTERYIYVDGVLEGSSTTDAGSISDSGNLPLYFGTAASNQTASLTTGSIALGKLSATAPSAAQVRAMYEAEKPMFATGAKVLLQSGTTDAVLDVDVDPISGNVAVTQTDDAGIWDGLVYTAQTITTGGTTFEHTKLWGNGYVEINDANLGISMPAENLREMAEAIRGLGIQMEGVDLSKAKAWCNSSSNGVINASYNIEAVTHVTTGQYKYEFAVPFKSADGYTWHATAANAAAQRATTTLAGSCHVYTWSTGTSSATNAVTMVVWFGELEGE